MTGYRTATPGTVHTAPADRWAWTDDAGCRGESLDLFYSPDGERAAERTARETKAKAVCWRCPVEQLCRDDAVATKDTWGVRGGMTPEELTAERRRRLRKGQLTTSQTCMYGHPKTEANTHRDKRGYRRCLACYQLGSRRNGNRRAAA